MRRLLPVIVITFAMLACGAAFAQEQAAAETQQPAVANPATETEAEAEVKDEKATTLEKIGRVVKFNAQFQSIFVYKNDSDFDDTKPLYDENGQSVGYLGTFFKPQLALKPVEELTIFYEAELGLNLWSRDSAAAYESGRNDTFQLAHREIYAEGHFVNDLIGFKVGYQKFYDPSGLFLGHWLGAASIISDPKWAKFTLSVGQLPDQTYEGITLNENNFKHDTLVYGLRVDVPAWNWMNSISFYGLYDDQIVDQTTSIFAPMYSVKADYEIIDFGLDFVFQAGNTRNGGAFSDETTVAWALQGWADLLYKGFGFQFNQLVLSPDDNKDRNKHNGGFYYSGKARSRTIMLSEDEIRDRGGNIDEAVSVQRGQFYVVRPGYSLSDIAFSYNIKDIFVPALIFGMAFALEKDNAMGATLAGIETDIDLEFRYKKVLSAHLIGAFLAPGKAAGVFVNTYDRKANEMQYMVETSLQVFF